jgi:hypothetical protein
MSEWINWKRYLFVLNEYLILLTFVLFCLSVAVTMISLKRSSTMQMKIVRNNVLLTERSILVV